jgi:hypothetical protein
MAPLAVVEIPEANQFGLQVASIPKRYEIEILSPDCPDEPFHKRVRNRYVGHGLHLCYREYSKIGLPPMESEQGIIITTDISRRSGSTDRMVEHPAQRWSIDGTGLYAESNNSARELIHDDEHPMALQNEGFATEQIDAPQAIFEMTEYC